MAPGGGGAAGAGGWRAFSAGCASERVRLCTDLCLYRPFIYVFSAYTGSGCYAFLFFGVYGFSYRVLGAGVGMCYFSFFLGVYWNTGGVL